MAPLSLFSTSAFGSFISPYDPSYLLLVITPLRRCLSADPNPSAHSDARRRRARGPQHRRGRPHHAHVPHATPQGKGKAALHTFPPHSSSSPHSDFHTCSHFSSHTQVPLWSRIGRLKRQNYPKLTGGGHNFGGGASAGVMSAVAGRLLCDTYLIGECRHHAYGS